MALRDFLITKVHKFAANFLFAVFFLVIATFVLEAGVITYQSPRLAFVEMQTITSSSKQKVLGASITNQNAGGSALPVSPGSPSQTACGQTACIGFTLNSYDDVSASWGGTITVTPLSSARLYGDLQVNGLLIYSAQTGQGIGSGGIKISLNNFLLPGQNASIILSAKSPFINGVPLASLTVALPPSPGQQVSKCIYPGAPDKCSYVPGANYDAMTDCGRILTCATQIVQDPSVDQAAPTSNFTPASTPAGYTFCASENEVCNFSGSQSVAYGANQSYVYQVLTGPVRCGNGIFGDPIPGAVKSCYVSNAPAPAMKPSTIVNPQPVSGQTTKNNLVIKASGTSVNGIFPTMELRLGQSVLGSWQVSSQLQDYSLATGVDLSLTNLRVYFTNDAYSPPAEDRNLFVDSLTINGAKYDTTNANVYSEGAWDASGCAPGYKQVNWLYCNGFFEFPTSSLNTNVNPVSNSPTANAPLVSNVQTQYWLHPGFAQLSPGYDQLNPVSSDHDLYQDLSQWGDVLGKTNVFSFFIEDVANQKRYNTMDRFKKRLAVLSQQQINIETLALRTGENSQTCDPSADPSYASELDWSLVPECKANPSSPSCVGKISGALDLWRMQPIYDAGRQVAFDSMDNPINRVLSISGHNNYCNFNLHDASLATAAYMSTVHKAHPEIQFDMFVAFPNVNYKNIPAFDPGAVIYGYGNLNYSDVLNDVVSTVNSAGLKLNALHVDSPYNYIYCAPGHFTDNRCKYDYMARIVDLSKQARSLGLKFGMVFNSESTLSAPTKQAVAAADQQYADDTYNDIKKFVAAGGVLDDMIIESWYYLTFNEQSLATPNYTFPESQTNSFLNIASNGFDLYKSLAR